MATPAGVASVRNSRYKTAETEESEHQFSAGTSNNNYLSLNHEGEREIEKNEAKEYYNQ